MHDNSRCEKHRSDYDKRRGSSTQRLYDYRWQKASKTYLSRNPLCVYCQRAGRITAATLVDHKTPHHGDLVLFWDESNWQALCTNCHSSTKQSEEKKTFRPW